MRATTSAIAASKAVVPTRCDRLWIRTFSEAGCSKPASRIRFMRPDSPGPLFSSMFLVPTMPPRPKATRTKASQPNVAAFQWSALQRPIRAARFRFVCVVLDISRSSSGRVGVGVVEGVERAIGRDRDLEAVAGPRVLDGHGQGVLGRMPEQQDVDAVVVASGKLARLRCGAHCSSL